MTNQKHEIIHMEEAKLTPQRVESAIKQLPVIARDRMNSIQAMEHVDIVAKAITECTTIALGVYLDNRIDVIAALAKYLKDDKLTIAAKRVKLENYRKLGELAELERPTARLSGYTSEQKRERRNQQAREFKKRKETGAQMPGRGTSKGAASLLKGSGFTDKQAHRILAISRIPDDKFKEIIKEPIPPAPVVAATFGLGNSSLSRGVSSSNYREFSHHGTTFRAVCRKNPPVELARGMTVDEAKKAREIVVELQEWLDAFEQALPK